MKMLTLPAIEIRQNGSRLLFTKMRVADLATHTKIEVYDSTKDFDDPTQGYQRAPELPRVKKFARWLIEQLDEDSSDREQKIRMPTAILLSSRGADIALSPQGTITLKETAQLPLVDGQHRKCGFEYAINVKGRTELAEFEVPVVIMLDLDKIGEMRVFNTVNSTAKQVRTDLVNMILTQVVAREGEDAVKPKEHWKVVVSHAVRLLNEDQQGPWYDRIVMPNTPPYTGKELDDDESLKHRRIVRATSFMQSLKPIEAYLAEFDAKPTDSLEERAARLASVIGEFWCAIEAKMPKCFEEADNYVLQKTPGVFSCHMLCRELLKGMLGRCPLTQKNYETMLAENDALEDSFFWFVGNEQEKIMPGEATKYGSMKGFSDLFDLLDTKAPRKR